MALEGNTIWPLPTSLLFLPHPPSLVILKYPTHSYLKAFALMKFPWERTQKIRGIYVVEPAQVTMGAQRRGLIQVDSLKEATEAEF